MKVTQARIVIKIKQWISNHEYEKLEEEIRMCLKDFGIFNATIHDSATGNDITISPEEE